jgi:hypothetical protein
MFLKIIEKDCNNNSIGKITKTDFKIKTAFRPLVSGDPSKIFQDLLT